MISTHASVSSTGDGNQSSCKNINNSIKYDIKYVPT